MNICSTPSTRRWLVGVTAFLAMLAITASSPGLVITEDFGGTPRQLAGSDSSQPSSVTTIDVPAGTYFDEGSIATVADLDVLVKVRHPNVKDLAIWLRHIVFDDAGIPDIRTISLLNGDGCTSGDYDTNTVFNEDVSVYFDDSSVASIIFACDRSIPTLNGRHSPSTAFPAFGGYTEDGLAFAEWGVLSDEGVGLNWFNGRPVLNNALWQLVILDSGDTGESAALVEWSLIFNDLEEGDIAPREETATISSAQSANGLISISDHVGSALFLLGYLSLDHRIVERLAINLAEYEGDFTPDASGMVNGANGDDVPISIFFNDDLFENLRRGTGLEYSVLDTAPGSSSGDGIFSVADWVQTTRYASGLGFDEPVKAGGPVAPSDRIVRLGNTIIPRGTTAEIPVYLTSKGVEHEIGFGLQFDPTVLEFVSAERGPCLPANANFQINNESAANETGVFGLQVGLLPDQTFLCNFETPPAILSGADGEIDGATFDSDNTKPASLLYEVRAGVQVSSEVATVSNTAPIILTTAGNHSFRDGDSVSVSGVRTENLDGSINLNAAANGTWTVSIVSPNQIQLNGSVGDGVYSYGGVAQLVGPDPIDFSNPERPIINVRLFVENPTEDPITDYNFDIAYEGTRLVPLGVSDVNPLFSSSTPSGFGIAAPLDSAPTQTFEAVSISDSSDTSTFVEGYLATVQFAVVVRTVFNTDTGEEESSTAEPIILFKKGFNTVFNTEIFGTSSPFIRVQFDNGELNPVTSRPVLRVVDGSGATSTTGCASQGSADLTVVLDRNINPVTSYGFQLTYDSRRLSFQDLFNEDYPTFPFFDFLTIPGNLAYLAVSAGDDQSLFLNGELFSVEFAQISAESSHNVTPQSFSGAFFNSGDRAYRADFAPYRFICDQARGDVEMPITPTEDEKEEIVASSDDRQATGPIITTELESIRLNDDDEVELVIGINVANNTTPVTDYNFLLNYDVATLELVSIIDGDGNANPGLNPGVWDYSNCSQTGTGVFADQDPDIQASIQQLRSFYCFDQQTRFSTSERANTSTTLLAGRNSDSTFTSGRLATLIFRASGEPVTAPSVQLTSIPPISETVQIASLYFQPRDGAGAVVSELQFAQDPIFFTAPTVRNVAGVPVYASFANAGVTVIDNADRRPTVRVVDTVLASGTEGTVQVALESVGVENAVGFTLNFDPSTVQLMSAEPGRDIPDSGFFYTYPNVNAVEDANQTGRLAMLMSLQPGASFEEGVRYLANLRFQPIESEDTIDTAINFSPLFDTTEVVDPEGVPVVTRFPNSSIAIAGDECEYVLVPDAGAGETDEAFDTDGGVGNFEVQVPSGCPWTAVTAQEWITIVQGASGVGNGTVVFSVAANSEGERTGSIEIAGQTYDIVQEGCTFDLTPERLTYASPGGTGQFEVVTADSCPWTAESDVSWIILTSAGFGTGTGTIDFEVERNVGLPRVGTITIAMGDVTGTFEVIQEVCRYDLTPPEITDVPIFGGSYEIDIDTEPDAEDVDEEFEICPWTVTTDDDWINIAPESSSGIGDGTIEIVVEANAGDARSGSILIADIEYIITQVGATNCDYVVLPDRQTFSALGGEGTFAISTAEGCPWLASTESDWITITSANSGTGNGNISYTVALNEDATRTGTITVGDATHTIQQFGGDEFVFEFRNDADGWTFGTASPPFTAPTENYNPGTTDRPGRLELTTSNNTNTFGWWESPVLALVSPLAAEDLYEATFIVSGSAQPADAPDFRIRASNTDFSQSTVFVSTSSGSGNYSPTGTGKTYRQVFSMPDGTPSFRTFFDVLSFDPSQAVSEATVSLERIRLRLIEPTQVEDPRLERRLVLANESSTDLWSSVAPGIGEPEFSVLDRGLSIGSSNGSIQSDEAVFGFWSWESDITLDAGRLYAAKFLVSAGTSSALEIRKSLVPAFRLRVNDSQFKSSVYVNIESINDNSAVPTFLEKREYTVYFLAPPELDNRNLYFAFDYLFAPESFNDPTINLVLEVLEVTSYRLLDEPPPTPTPTPTATAAP